MRGFERQGINLAWSEGESLPAAILTAQTLPEILHRAAMSDRDLILVNGLDSASNYFYRDLLQDATCILTGLRQQQGKPQDKIILQLQQPRYFFASLWACWLGGLVPIPLGVDVTGEKLQDIHELCEHPLTVTDTVVEPNDSLPLEKISVTELLNCPQNHDYHHGNLDDLALLLFTSGSTGKPKGVKLSVRNLLASIYGMAKVNHLSSQDITLNWMPLEHVASLVMFHLTEVYLGCRQIQVKSEIILQHPLQWLDLIHKYRVTATWSPNFAYSLVNQKVAQTDKWDWDLSCLRWMGNGAEAVVGKTARRFIELLAPYGFNPAVISPGYGMTETTSGICHSNDFYLNTDRELVSVGAPIPGVALRIVDENNRLLSAGATGLLQVKGETVTTGYYGQPQLNTEVFTTDGWFNTGDLGFIVAGQLTITGRQKEIIIINGVNYYNQEIETAVEAIPEVNLSFTAACGVKDRQQQEQIAIFFNTDVPPDSLRQLINRIRQQVFTEIGVAPAYIIPVTQASIPKTAIGKIRHSQLSHRFHAGEFNPILDRVAELSNQRNLNATELPSNAIEQQLVAIWQEILKIKKVGVRDNFFELGGNSLLLMQMLGKLTPEYNLSAVDLFQYPTITALASYLSNEQESIAVQQGKRRGELRRTRNQDVAIIGMACRFPGANNLEEFWHNLCHGVESISFLSHEEMINSGVAAELVNHPDYVNASPILENIENFDAQFWGFTPKEARLLDPQQRLFLECAWESLEDAGYDPFSYEGDISLYGGAATNTYLLNNIYPNRHHIDDRDRLQVVNLSSMGGFQVSTANDKDYLTTRTSYKLNFRGSSVNVQTACSTSLVAVHLACQSLINYESDMALAGGVSVHSPQKMGYLHQEGMILSADGHCRAFDASASGTIFGSGAGMVVLKLLDRAIEDGDRIYGVIKGSAVNNDGGSKVGYHAPNLDGQAKVVAEALTVADVPTDSISYVEAHGTGTKLGDPIEITALSQAYHDDTKKTGYCAVGSVKTNVGHLQMASGIAGLIKTVLSLSRGKIPPSLHFRQPNPQIDFPRSPFYLNTQLQDWQTANYPRRAGVNSLGIGGTNAHVILEEFVNQKATDEQLLPAYLLTLSAKSTIALQQLAKDYREFLVDTLATTSLRDICFTSNIGRHHFELRCAITASNKQELIAKLTEISPVTIQQNHKIAFLFTGQGSQYVGMAQQLYDTCRIFREHCDRCFQVCERYLDIPLQKIFFAADASVLNQTQSVQPLLFVIEYSLAQLWIAWGIQPDVLLGHSIGEYTAACIAGVFSLEDGLRLVTTRGKLMQELPDTGAMVAVFVDFSPRHQDGNRDANQKYSKSDFQALLDRDRNVCIAADNGSHLVLSGLKTAINQVIQELDALDIKYKLLDIDRGFHSPLMEPMVESFKAVAETITYSLPNIPLVANLTGELAQENIATADYWISHILQPVQFAKGIEYLNRQQVNIFLEIGSKPILTGIVKSLVDNKLFLPSLDERQADWQQMLTSLAELYTAGVAIEWTAATQDYHGNKISLPTYPFQGQRYWFDLPSKAQSLTISRAEFIHPLLGKLFASPLKQTIFQTYLNIDTHPWLQDHCLENTIIFPGAGYLEMAIALGLFETKTKQLLLENIAIVAPLYLDVELIPDQEIQIIASRQETAWHWQIYSSDHNDWNLHCSGVISLGNTPTTTKTLSEIKNSFSNNSLDVQQHYLSCRQKGINYGKSFQGIKQLWSQDRQALGLIELPTAVDDQQYHFHPALLDASLQILFAALPPELQNNTYIPVSVDKLHLYSLPGERVWSYLELTATADRTTLTADVWLYNQEQELIAKLEGLKSQAIGSQPSWHDWLYQPQWIPQPQSQSYSLLNPGTWLIFANNQGIAQQIATKLQSPQQQCHLISRDDLENTPQAWLDLIRQYPNLTGVIYLWGLDNTDNEEVCQSYLYLVQALIQHQHNLSLYLITHNAQVVNKAQLPSGINNSCLWGMQKAIALEHPGLNCMGIDLDSLANQGSNIYQEICNAANEQVAYRGNKRYVARLVRYHHPEEANSYLPSALHDNCQLQINNPGNLDSLQWQAVNRQAPQNKEIEIEVKATGLNFRDVMTAMDLYPDATQSLGLEAAGVVTAVGQGVENYQVGDRVIAIAEGSFSRYVTTNSLLAIPQPELLTFEAAATIPVTFLTAYYTLVHLAQLQPGETILIHSAAGGVGIAAIQIAQDIGAEIYATASSAKWSLLKSMGVTQVMNSRSLDFAETIVSATKGKGVDVVLNCLTGEFITKSLEVLKPQGRFLEIGKQNIWTTKAVKQVKPQINYFIVDLWQITQDHPQLIQQLLKKLLALFTTDRLKPLPYTTFTGDRFTDAFRYMQQGKHRGKIIITPPSPNFTGTYLIAGGMGAIGLQVAQWLVTKGVKSLVLLGRNAVKPEARNALQNLAKNTQLTCIKADITNTKQLAQVLAQIKLTLPPLKGIVHCAGVKCDRPIEQLDWNSFQTVLAPKTTGVWNLHQLTATYDLENFILFSSAASLVGSAGQANYCAANAFLDILAYVRRSQGLPAIAINWAAWENMGLAAEPGITEAMQQKGIGSIEPIVGIEILEELLTNSPVQVGVMPINWQQWQQHHSVTPFYQELVEDTPINSDRQNYQQQLKDALPEHRKQLIMQQISTQVTKILGIRNSSEIDLQLGFSELGLDSLSTVELRNKLQSHYNLKLAQTIIFDYPQIQSLGEYLLSLMFPETTSRKPDNHNQKITDLSETEAEQMLLKELENFDTFFDT